MKDVAKQRHCGLHSVLLLLAIFGTLTACHGRSATARDVLTTPSGSSELTFNRCRVGVGHYVGLTPFGVTGSRPIVLHDIQALGPASAVSVSATVADFDKGYIGGTDGDKDLQAHNPNLRTAPVGGATVQPHQEPFYLLVRIASLRPGSIVVPGLRLRYSVGGKPATHDFRYQLTLNDYTAPTSAAECRIGG